MSRSARHQGPLTPRWVRGLLTGALMAFFSTNFVGCGLDYVFRNISPLHPTGWSFAFAPGKDDSALAAALAVTFRITKAGGTYHFALKDFPPVTLDVPPEDGNDIDKKDEERKK